LRCEHQTFGGGGGGGIVWSRSTTLPAVVMGCDRSLAGGVVALGAGAAAPFFFAF
jgi:hypothetical protein